MARYPFVSRRCGLAGICLCVVLLGAGPLRGQLEPAPEAGGGGPATGTQPSPGGQPAAASQGAVPRVIEARSSRRDSRNRVGLGDGLTVQVQNLTPALEKIPKGCEGLILFLNEIPIKGVPPESCDDETGNVHYTLDRTDESDRAWHVLLEEPIAFWKTVSVSVGPQGNLAYPSKVEVKLEVLPERQLYGYFVGLALFLLILFRLATRTALLRDPAPLGGNAKLAPYSLARFQLAFWSFIVVAAYVFIWLITGELDTITGSVLALLGIGSATALSAKLIDTSKPSAEASEGETAAPAPIPVKHTVSQGFLRDVLSDSGGISLYRLQLFVWTLVLGIIFVASVYDGLQMPQFSTTLLGLMGISSGTYVGFKVPESRAAPSP